MIKLTPLFSGSSGNSTLLQTPHANLLLDAGYGFKATVARLAKSGVSVADIAAFLVTHEHSDHVSALKTFAKHTQASVFVPQNAANYVAQTCFYSNVEAVIGSFDLVDVHVDVYRCSHDARACVGYRFSTDDDCVGCVTDTGIADDELVEFLSPCRTVFLESNHDLDMLWNGPYPYVLKKRVASPLGHLSNDQAAEVLEKLLNYNVKNVVLAHMSRQNNDKMLAFESASKVYEKHGLKVGKDVTLVVADQFENEVTL